MAEGQRQAVRPVHLPQLLHLVLVDEDVVWRDGVRVTTVLRTVLDLCRSLPLAQGVEFKVGA